MTDNKTLLKQFANIYTSCNKAKQGAIAEIGKIDEKYRKLAEKEKEQLNELVKTLESQMEMYGKYLGLNKTEETPEAPVVEEEAEVKDELFPENNEVDESKDAAEPAQLAESAPVADVIPVDSAVATDFVRDEWPGGIPSESWEQEPEKVEVPVAEKKELPALEISDDGWAQFPEEWK